MLAAAFPAARATAVPVIAALMPFRSLVRAGASLFTELPGAAALAAANTLAAAAATAAAVFAIVATAVHPSAAAATLGMTLATALRRRVSLPGSSLQGVRGSPKSQPAHPPTRRASVILYVVDLAGLIVQGCYLLAGARVFYTPAGPRGPCRATPKKYVRGPRSPRPVHDPGLRALAPRPPRLRACMFCGTGD